MNSKKLKAYFQLSRPINVGITFISIPVACWIAGGKIDNWFLYILAGLTGAFVTAGANAINDSFDIEIDKINRPKRPLVRGALTQRDAKKMWYISSLVAIIINLYINNLALFIVVCSIIVLYYYSAKLKRTIVVGNSIVGLMTGMAFIYGGVVVGKIDLALMPALFAFLSNFARELVKDVEDIEGDRRDNAITLPVKYGIKPSLVLTTVLLVLLIGSTMFAVSYSIYNHSFLYIVLIADVLIIASIFLLWQNSSRNNLRIVSRNIKLIMMIGLMSIIAGSV